MITVMDLDNYKKDVNNSIERFDGFNDGLWNEYYKAQEELNFIETFGSLENYNTKAKLDMLNKINKAYGKCNRGIENYCRIQSLEAEAEAVEETDNNTEEKTDNNSAKKTKWYQIVWEKIKAFFQKIKEVFTAIVDKIKGFFKKNEDVDQAIEEAIVEAPKEVESLSQYLGEVNVNEDKSNKLVKINSDTASLLIKKTGEYLQISTQFSDAVKNLSTYGNVDGVKKFVDMAQKMYPNKLNFGSMNGTDEKAYKEYKDRVEKIANSFKYDDNRNGYLSYINSGLLDAQEGKKITAVDVMGTKDVKEIRKIFKELKKSISDSTNNINKASDLCRGADKAFQDYVNKNTAENNKEVTDDQRKLVYEIAGICTAMFKTVTNMSNIYLNMVKDISKTMTIIEKFTISGAQKFISALKKAKEAIGKKLTSWGLVLKGKGEKIYNSLSKDVKSAYDAIVRPYKEKQAARAAAETRRYEEHLDEMNRKEAAERAEKTRQKIDALKAQRESEKAQKESEQNALQAKLKENEVKQLISDLEKSCGKKIANGTMKGETTFVDLLIHTLVDNGFVADKSEAEKYINGNQEMRNYHRDAIKRIYNDDTMFDD